MKGVCAMMLDESTHKLSLFPPPQSLNLCNACLLLCKE